MLDGFFRSLGVGERENFAVSKIQVLGIVLAALFVKRERFIVLAKIAIIPGDGRIDIGGRLSGGKRFIGGHGFGQPIGPAQHHEIVVGR